MLIAVTALENSLQSEIDPRFGRAAYYMIVNTETDEVTVHNNSDGVGSSNGAGTGAAQTLSEYGVKALYTGSVGPKAAEVLQKANIPYYENITGTVQGVLDQLKNGQVSQSTDQNNSAQVETQPETNNAPTATPQCPGALPAVGQGMGLGRGQGTGRGTGRGMGAGRGAGSGQGRGMCRR
ncbi:MAG: NifB/NifX family molybdenum-iron cluster-binding protein [Desulfuromusa sp.]|jgi:predicted Fe-Mo cluster-binding NifX family protein|nr:NifB/NifX family molybdenum-iron cluster-binding protein [Desulfuromusa sp.]